MTIVKACIESVDLNVVERLRFRVKRSVTIQVYKEWLELMGVSYDYRNLDKHVEFIFGDKQDAVAFKLKFGL